MFYVGLNKSPYEGRASDSLQLSKQEGITHSAWQPRRHGHRASELHWMDFSLAALSRLSMCSPTMCMLRIPWSTSAPNIFLSNLVPFISEVSHNHLNLNTAKTELLTVHQKLSPGFTLSVSIENDQLPRLSTSSLMLRFIPFLRLLAASQFQLLKHVLIHQTSLFSTTATSSFHCSSSAPSILQNAALKIILSCSFELIICLFKCLC